LSPWKEFYPPISKLFGLLEKVDVFRIFPIMKFYNVVQRLIRFSIQGLRLKDYQSKKLFYKDIEILFHLLICLAMFVKTKNFLFQNIFSLCFILSLHHASNMLLTLF